MQSKSKLARGWPRVTDGGLRPFLLYRHETEERSVSRQTQDTSCFCPQRRTISESHCRSIIGVMLSNMKEAFRHQHLSAEIVCESVCVRVLMLRVSYTCTCLSPSPVVLPLYHSLKQWDKFSGHAPSSAADSAFSVTEQTAFNTPVPPLPNASAANQFRAFSELTISLCS